MKAFEARTLRGFSLTADQRADLIEFLKSLTDTELLSDPRLSDPGSRR